MSTDPYLNSLVAGYRNAKNALFSHRGNRFQRNSLVRVDSPRYRGLGMVVDDPACPVDQLPVLLCNGNVWWYPAEKCEPSDDPIPRELRHAVLDRAGIAHL